MASDLTSFGINRRVTWRTTGPRYRMLLYGHGEERLADAKTGKTGRLGMTRDEVEQVLKRGGELSVADILQCRVRYLTDGAAIGSAQFLQEIFEENRRRFGEKRTTAGKRMDGSNWGGLQVLRGLQKNVFSS